MLKSARAWLNDGSEPIQLFKCFTVLVVLRFVGDGIWTYLHYLRQVQSTPESIQSLQFWVDTLVFAGLTSVVMVLTRPKRTVQSEQSGEVLVNGR